MAVTDISSFVRGVELKSSNLTDNSSQNTTSFESDINAAYADLGVSSTVFTGAITTEQSRTGNQSLRLRSYDDNGLRQFGFNSTKNSILSFYVLKTSGLTGGSQAGLRVSIDGVDQTFSNGEVFFRPAVVGVWEKVDIPITPGNVIVYTPNDSITVYIDDLSIIEPEGVFTEITQQNSVAKELKIYSNPTFETRNGVEGMVFNNSSSELISFPLPMLWEGSILAVLQPDTAGITHAIGGALTSNNTHSLMCASQQVQAFNPGGGLSSGYTSAPISSPFVVVGSWCPELGRISIQANDNPPVIAQATNGSFHQARFSWPEIMIGGHRTSNFSGWISKVYFFSRALHQRDLDGLSSIVSEEMTAIGL